MRKQTVIALIGLALLGLIEGGFMLWLRGMTGDFVAGFASGALLMTALLFLISPRIRKTLSEP